MSAKILLAEDNAINRYLATFLLEKAGFAIVHAHNGAEALRFALAEIPDLILMDIQMPEMGGVEATEIIRSLEAERGDPPMPIIALTANAMSHQIEQYLAAGMTAAVSKPIEPAELFRVIDDALQGDVGGADDAELRHHA